MERNHAKKDHAENLAVKNSPNTAFDVVPDPTGKS